MKRFLVVFSMCLVYWSSDTTVFDNRITTTVPMWVGVVVAIILASLILAEAIEFYVELLKFVDYIRSNKD